MKLELIDSYIAFKKNAWAPLTLKNERSRLNALPFEHLDAPDAMWEAIQDRSPYTRQTIWTRLCDLYDFLVVSGQRDKNIYDIWRKQNARQFKYVYQRQLPTISYAEAKRRISCLGTSGARGKALQLLESGLRIGEYNQAGSGMVYGKGGRPRPTVIGAKDRIVISDWAFRNELAAIGLKPHDLRKLAATRLYESGMSVVDICDLMGWTSFNTASSYIKSSKDLLKRAKEALR